MGLGRLELPTSRLSGVRSNHLSYRPRFARLGAYAGFPHGPLGRGKLEDTGDSFKCGPPVLPTAADSAYSGRFGLAMVRHMCEEAVLSNPSPSFGCLNWRPMMSVNTSMSTSMPSWKA